MARYVCLRVYSMSNVDVMKVLIITGNNIINVIHVSDGILSGNLVYIKTF